MCGSEMMISDFEVIRLDTELIDVRFCGDESVISM